MSIEDQKSFSISHILFTFLLALAIGFIVAYATGAFKPKEPVVHVVSSTEQPTGNLPTDAPQPVVNATEPAKSASSIVGTSVLGMFLGAGTIGASVFVLRRYIPEGSHFQFYIMKYGVRYSVIITLTIMMLVMAVNLYNAGHDSQGFVAFGIFALFAAGTFFYILANHLTLKVKREARAAERRLANPDTEQEGSLARVLAAVSRDVGGRVRVLGRPLMPPTREERAAARAKKKAAKRAEKPRRFPGDVKRVVKSMFPLGARRLTEEEAEKLDETLKKQAAAAEAKVKEDLGAPVAPGRTGLRRRMGRRMGEIFRRRPRPDREYEPEGDHKALTAKAT